MDGFGFLLLVISLLSGCLLGGFVAAVFLQKKASHVFSSLAGEALTRNNQIFLDLARTSLEHLHSEAGGVLAEKEQSLKELIQPLRLSLDRYEGQVRELESRREQAYGGLNRYLRNVTESQAELRRETGNLVKALRASHVRGQWGEMSLKRLVELAGMVEHCDFALQQTLEGSSLRPDLTVLLPNRRRIIVDAKVPLDSYLQAVDCEVEAERDRLLAEHASQLRRHIAALSRKAYCDHIEPGPEFVVLYIPLESLYSAALRCDPRLLDVAVEKRVILATPSTLIALLKTVELGWRQEKLAQNAEEVSSLARELHERLAGMCGHFSKMGRSLDRAVQAYNQTARSLESRVLVQTRRFKDLGVRTAQEIPEMSWIDRRTRRPRVDACEESPRSEEIVSWK